MSHRRLVFPTPAAAVTIGAACFFLIMPAASQGTPFREGEIDRWVSSATTRVREAEETPGFESNRCTIGGFVSPNKIVVGLFGIADVTLQLGDRILGLNGRAVRDRNELSEQLNPIALDSMIEYEIERLGRRQVVRSPCINAAPYRSARLRLWRAIAARDWGECMEATLASQSLMGPTPENTESYLFCGRLSGRLTPAQGKLAMYEAVRALIEQTRWDPLEWREARPRILANMHALEEAGQAAFVERLGSLVSEADRMQPSGTAPLEAAPSRPTRKPEARGDSLAFPAFADYRWVGDLVLGETTLEDAVRLFPPTLGEGSPRRPQGFPVARAGKFQPKPVRVFNPYRTMYALFFDRNDRLVILQEIGDELEQQPVADLLSKYPVLRETQRLRDERELQGEIARCVVLMLLVDGDDRIQSAAYVYSCPTEK
jgi:hypothetical protein